MYFPPPPRKLTPEQIEKRRHEELTKFRNELAQKVFVGLISCNAYMGSPAKHIAQEAFQLAEAFITELNIRNS